MTHFASVVRLKVKPGMNAEFERVAEELYATSLADVGGRTHSRIIKTGESTYCTFAEWESEEALANGRHAMGQLLDRLRPTLDEVSPELGVTDPVSGAIILSR